MQVLNVISLLFSFTLLCCGTHFLLLFKLLKSVTFLREPLRITGNSINLIHMLVFHQCCPRLYKYQSLHLIQFSFFSFPHFTHCVHTPSVSFSVCLSVCLPVSLSLSLSLCPFKSSLPILDFQSLLSLFFLCFLTAYILRLVLYLIGDPLDQGHYPVGESSEKRMINYMPLLVESSCCRFEQYHSGFKVLPFQNVSGNACPSSAGSILDVLLKESPILWS